MLLDAGADINAQHQDGITALHLALEENYCLLSHLLVTRGARTDWPDINREKLDFFLSACHSGQITPLAQVLLKMADFPTFAGINLTGPNVRGLFGDYPLHIVMYWNDLDAARTLIEAGANINARGEHGHTPLHEACANGNPEMVELLLAHGADLFARNDGDYAFTHARLRRQDVICELLSPHYKNARKADPQVELKSRIRQLKDELQECEEKLKAAQASN